MPMARSAWRGHAKGTVWGIYKIDDPGIAQENVIRLGHDLQQEECPPEIQRLSHTIARWRDQTTASHQAKVCNRPTDGANRLIKRLEGGGVWVPPVLALPDSGLALRRTTELCATRHRLILRKREEPSTLQPGHDANRLDGTCVDLGIVEERVEQLYQRLALTPEHVRALRETLDQDIERVDQESAAVVAAQEERLKRLTDEERKNAAAYRADALSLDALKAERERIDAERLGARRVIARSQVRYDELRDVIAQALDLAEDASALYTRADDQVRRLLNQAFFEKVLVQEDDVVDPEYSEPYQRMIELSSETWVGQVRREQRERRYERARQPQTGADGGQKRLNPARKIGQGSSKTVLVREEGLEPSRPFGHRNLNPARLPIPPLARVVCSDGIGGRP